MEELSEDLNDLLCDLNVFYRKLQNYHWNVKGKEFFTVHAKLEEYYDCVNEEIDEVAEHILTLGKQPLGTLKDYLENASIEEASNVKVDEDEIFNNVLADMKTIVEKLMLIKQEAEEYKEYVTSSLMDEYISKYSKKMWMLNQMMS